jgi:hypothetical protein
VDHAEAEGLAEALTKIGLSAEAARRFVVRLKAGGGSRGRLHVLPLLLTWVTPKAPPSKSLHSSEDQSPAPVPQVWMIEDVRTGDAPLTWAGLVDGASAPPSENTKGERADPGINGFEDSAADFGPLTADDWTAARRALGKGSPSLLFGTSDRVLDEALEALKYGQETRPAE